MSLKLKFLEEELKRERGRNEQQSTDILELNNRIDELQGSLRKKDDQSYYYQQKIGEFE